MKLISLTKKKKQKKKNLEGDEVIKLISLTKKKKKRKTLREVRSLSSRRISLSFGCAVRYVRSVRQKKEKEKRKRKKKAHLFELWLRR